MEDLRKIAEENRGKDPHLKNRDSECKRLEAALARIRRLKQGSYEDYQDKLLSKEEFLRYKADYDQQEQTLLQQMERMQEDDEADLLEQPWVDELLSQGELMELDRVTLSQTVKEIRIFEGKRIEINYLFSEELRALLEKREELG